MTEFTPLAGAAGGLLIGLSAVLLMGGLGRIAGVSGIFRALFTGAAGWQALFLLGLLAGTILTALLGGFDPGTITFPGNPLTTVIGGLLVGVVPVALGLLWLPALRRARPVWLSAFMAFTAGLLAFLGVEALAEAFQLQATLPAALGGAGLVLLGVGVSFLGMSALAGRVSRGAATGSAAFPGRPRRARP